MSRLLEETEDEVNPIPSIFGLLFFLFWSEQELVLTDQLNNQLSELIKKGSVKVGEVNKVLCQDLGTYCSQTR